jgi:hypothetical protein
MVMTDTKEYRLKQLGSYRKENCYPGFKNLYDFHNGQYESDFVSPYSKGSGNFDSQIFILLQDWVSEDGIKKGLDEGAITLGYSPGLRTNKNLQKLLNETFQLEISEVFTTNLFPFIKVGAMNAPIGAPWLRKAFDEFTMPQINIIKPKVVVCCGKKVYRTVLKCLLNISPVNVNFTDHICHGKILYVCQNHPGSRGTVSVGGQKGATRNWQIMKKLMEQNVCDK